MYHVGKIVRRYVASPTVVVLELEVPTLSSFSPGQWVDFVVRPNDWIGGFSIASSPQMLPKITLAIKRSSYAPSTWVHEESSVGDSVEVQVSGTCTLEKRAFEKPAVFCAGGIGISPVLAQYREYLSSRQTEHFQSRSMFLYSVSTQDELVFADELLALRKDPQIDKLVFTLTKASKWEGQVTDNKAVELRTSRQMEACFDQAPPESTFYICGPPGMIDDAISYLQSKGIPSERIRYEKWW